MPQQERLGNENHPAGLSAINISLHPTWPNEDIPRAVPTAPLIEDDQQERSHSNYRVQMHAADSEAMLADARGQEDIDAAERKANHECIVCMDSESVMLMKPCKHLCMCKECWIQYKQDNNSCPICRAQLKMSDIEEIIV